MKTVKSSKDITTLEVDDVVVFGDLEYEVSRGYGYFLNLSNYRNDRIFIDLNISKRDFIENLGIDANCNVDFPETKSLEALTIIVSALFKEYEKQNALPKTIEIPNNKEIDWEASAKQKQIVFKDKQLTYEDVCEKLFEEGHYHTDEDGNICFVDWTNECPNNASTKHQLECILAKNKLANVAVYLNNGWKPNLSSDYGYCIVLDYYGDLKIDFCAILCSYSLSKVVFKSKESAKQAIEILGEDTIKLALEPLY